MTKDKVCTLFSRLGIPAYPNAAALVLNSGPALTA